MIFGAWACPRWHGVRLSAHTAQALAAGPVSAAILHAGFAVIFLSEPGFAGLKDGHD